METITSIFRIGVGPSSSHTMAPGRAAHRFQEMYPNAADYTCALYGSLAATGRGHMTDKALEQAFTTGSLSITWHPETELPGHPNGMILTAHTADGAELGNAEVYSTGGGALRWAGDAAEQPADRYGTTTLDGIITETGNSGQSLWEYVRDHEDATLTEYLEQVHTVMQASLERGLKTEGVLPGGLGVSRKACSYHRKASMAGGSFKENGLVTAYALAVAEENAGGGKIVTAPTCGSSGVLPAVIRHMDEAHAPGTAALLNALATAGLIGTLIRHNASVAGAEVGCQGEIGTACAMAAAAACQLGGGTVKQIEYAAEMGMEHHLGLTCDPVDGLVQIPCIERNAHAAVSALNCAHYALFSDGTHRISFDDVIAVMKETGKALPSLYRETSGAGLAKVFKHQPDVKKND